MKPMYPPYPHINCSAAAQSLVSELKQISVSIKKLLKNTARCDIIFLDVEKGGIFYVTYDCGSRIIHYHFFE